MGGKARERTHLLTLSTYHMSLIKLVQRADVGQIYAMSTYIQITATQRNGKLMSSSFAATSVATAEQ
jgi:hypothetical protein